MSGCLLQYPDDATLCVAVGSNAWAGGFSYVIGSTASPALVARIRQGAPDGDMGVSKLAHAVAAHVLEDPAPFEAHWRRVLAQTRPRIAAPFDALVAAGRLRGDVPPYGCMAFPEVVGEPDTLALGRRLLREQNVLVVPGEYFGAPGRIRIGFGAVGEGLESGMARLADGLR